MKAEHLNESKVKRKIILRMITIYGKSAPFESIERTRRNDETTKANTNNNNEIDSDNKMHVDSICTKRDSIHWAATTRIDRQTTSNEPKRCVNSVQHRMWVCSVLSSSAYVFRFHDKTAWNDRKTRRPCAFIRSNSFTWRILSLIATGFIHISHVSANDENKNKINSIETKCFWKSLDIGFVTIEKRQTAKRSAIEMQIDDEATEERAKETKRN